MRIALIQVPYHLGREGVSVGAGPDRLVEAGATASLTQAGHDVEVVRVTRRNGETNEIGASFEVVRQVANAVSAATADGAFPLVLSGNCMSSVGIVAGLGRDVGVVWLDAHADFNTPETTRSGFQDGMALAVLTGTGWRALRETVPGFRAVAEENVVLVGVRDLDQAERERLDRSPLRVVAPRDLGQAEEALEALSERVDGVYLHVDLDVLDPSEGRANEYAAPDGLAAADVDQLVGAVAARFAIHAAALTAYDPAADPEAAIPPLAAVLAQRVVAGIEARSEEVRG